MDIKWMFRLYLIFILQELACLDDLSVSACYGITFDNFMSIQCEEDSVIALQDVKAMAKLQSTGCPQEETMVVSADESCCRYDSSDCGATYDGDVAPQYYMMCQGRPSCIYLQPTWVYTKTATECDPDIYLERTNYMIMEYKCISTKSAVGPCASVQVTDKSVFLWNDNYPNTIQSNHDGCSCSIETSCDSRIQITALDVRLLETDGTCQQSFILNDEGQTTHLGCETNNNYRAKTVYTSTSQFLVLELRNVASNNDGNFWFQITGSNKKADLILSCGSMKQQDTTDMKKKCQDDITSTTTPNSPSTTSTETISNTETTTTQSFSTEIVQKNTTVTTSALPTSTETISNMENTSFTILNNNTVTQSNEYENATRDNGDNSSSDSPNHTYPYTSTTIETPTTTILTLSSSTSQESLNNSYPFTTIIYNQTTDLVNTVYSPGVNNSDTGSVTNSNEVEGTTLAFNRTADMNDGAGNTNDEELTTVSVHGSEQKTGKRDDNPKGGSIATNHGGSDMMPIVIVAVASSIILVVGIILLWNRRKLIKCLCGKKTKGQIDPDMERTESPPQYDTMPSFLFYTGDSPVITSAAAKSTELHLQKLPLGGLVGRKQELEPLSPTITSATRLPPVDKKLTGKSPRKVQKTQQTQKTQQPQKTQKLGFLNMIMVEGYERSLPRLYPDDVEGFVKQSYGASSHATTDEEVLVKARENIYRKHRLRRKKKRLMERIHKTAESNRSNLF